MADVKQMCLEIIQQVDNSGLDYNINQTPYSIHFSIRKKFSKISSKKSMVNAGPDRSVQNDYLRQELLNMRFDLSMKSY